MRPFFPLLVALTFSLVGAADDQTETDALHQQLKQRVDDLSRRIQAMPDQESLYSARGDAWFFLGDFPKALADYSKMVELDPQADQSHWRRGIAYFYNAEYDQAVAQFERYHSFDDVDRENGIWRYLSQFHSQGAEAAQKELLKYEKDDREPFGDVYQLFSGDVTNQQILKKIESAQIDSNEREKRLFYANLYIGLNEAVNDRQQSALTYLKDAAKNKWAPVAGYGPNYMWHVARLHAEQIEKSLDSSQ